MKWEGYPEMLFAPPFLVIVGIKFVGEAKGRMTLPPFMSLPPFHSLSGDGWSAFFAPAIGVENNENDTMNQLFIWRRDRTEHTDLQLYPLSSIPEARKAH